MSVNHPELSSPEEIAAAGEQLYNDRHRARLEREMPGYFAVIDVNTGEVYVRQFPEEAVAEARRIAPMGILHIIRIGSEAAYRVSHLLHGSRSNRTL